MRLQAACKRVDSGCDIECSASMLCPDSSCSLELCNVRPPACAAAALALAAAPAAGESRRTKSHLAHEETGVKEETVAARLVAAKQATSFDSEMAHLNAELFPTEKKAAWHHHSPAAIRRHWSDVSAATMGTGGDELMRKAAFATSPKVVPAAVSKAAVRANKAVSKKEALSAAEQASAEIEHIKAVTEAAFPTMKKAVDEKQTANEMAAKAASETNKVFPKRFAKQEAKGKHLMAKELARVQAAQKELYGKVQARLKVKGMMKQANRVAMAQHRIAQEERAARLTAQKQKRMMHQHGASMASDGKPKKVLPNNWMTRKMQGQKNKEHKHGPAAGHHAGKPPASGGRKPISSDFAVPSDGTNVAFLGASQAGDKWFHGHSSVKKSQTSPKDNEKH
jgi:hypothetical protein